MLNIDFRLPSFHKSLATPNGNLYLTGGSIDTETAAKGKSKYIYQFDFNNNTLIPLATMFNPRSSHGICYMNNYIYMIGGFEKN